MLQVRLSQDECGCVFYISRNQYHQLVSVQRIVYCFKHKETQMSQLTETINAIGQWSFGNFGYNASATLPRPAWDAKPVSGSNISTDHRHLSCLGSVATLLGMVEECCNELLTADCDEARFDAIGDILIYWADYVHREEAEVKQDIPEELYTPYDHGIIIWLGKLARIVLKHHQGIRGYDNLDKYRTERDEALNQIFAHCHALVSVEFNMSAKDVMKQVFDKIISKRNWKKNPTNADAVAEKSEVQTEIDRLDSEWDNELKDHYPEELKRPLKTERDDPITRAEIDEAKTAAIEAKRRAQKQYEKDLAAAQLTEEMAAEIALEEERKKSNRKFPEPKRPDPSEDGYGCARRIAMMLEGQLQTFALQQVLASEKRYYERRLEELNRELENKGKRSTRVENSQVGRDDEHHSELWMDSELKND